LGDGTRRAPFDHPPGEERGRRPAADAAGPARAVPAGRVDADQPHVDSAHGVAARAADPKAPNREHIHAVVRTPNGNDYGKDLLRQHYAEHPH